MEIIQTVKKSILPSGSVLRMSFSIEGIYYIFLETNKCSCDCGGDLYGAKLEKELLWNGLEISEANVNFENFKNNPLIS
jgi:hypothetical protein